MLGFRDRPQWRTVAGGSQRYVEAIVRAARRAARAPRDAGRARSRATTSTSSVTPRGGEPERFDEVVIATHADQALRMLADRAASASASCSARSPTSATRSCCTPTAALLPRRRRAWASWNYHLLEREPGPSDRHLPHEPPAVARRRPRAARHAQPRRRRSAASTCSAASRYDHPVFTRRGRRRAARAGRELNGVDRTSYCGAYWGWGFHEDGVVSALRACARFGRAAVSASAIYEGASRHRRRTPVEHAFRYRLFMMYLDLDELPELFDGQPLWSARRPALARFRRADYLGDPGAAARRRRARPRRRRGSACARPGRCGCSRTCATSGTASTRSASTTASTPDGERVEAVVAEVTNTPWGERHAYVLAARRGTRSTCSRAGIAKAFHVSPFMGMEHDYALARSPTPGERLAVHIENRARRRARLRRDARAAPRAFTRGALTRVLRATRR